MEEFLQLLIHAAADACVDSIRMLPFLFAAFLLLELLEQYSGSYISRILPAMKRFGPCIGAALGCIPQCGFSVMAANLYAGGVISPGTLLSVFLATSDEAILILLGHPEQKTAILSILVVKIIIAITAGYMTDLLLGTSKAQHRSIENLCTNCGCHNRQGIFLPAWNHTIKLFIYIFIISALLNMIIDTLGVTFISDTLLGNDMLQPFFTALIGCIPNCAASVILTELYIGHVISFASIIAGLCTNAGVGLVVLFRINPKKRDSLRIAVILYAVSTGAGVILSLLSSF